MSSYTSLSDQFNSITSSRSVIHSEPFLNHLSCIVSCVRTSEQDVWCDLLVLTSGNWVIKGWVISGLWNYSTFFLRFFFFSKSQKHDFLRFWGLMHTFSRTLSTSIGVQPFHPNLLTSLSNSALHATCFCSWIKTYRALWVIKYDSMRKDIIDHMNCFQGVSSVCQPFT